MGKKQVHFGTVLLGVSGHMSMWRHPEVDPKRTNSSYKRGIL